MQRHLDSYPDNVLSGLVMISVSMSPSIIRNDIHLLLLR